MKFATLILLHVTIFVLFYDPRFVFTGTGVTKIVVILAFLLCLFSMTISSKKFQVSKNFVLCCSSFILIMLLLQYLAYFKGGDSFYYRTILSVITIHIPLAIMCSYLLGVLKTDLHKFFEMITCVCFAQACFIILDWISSGGTSMKQSFFASIVLQPVSTISTYRVSGFSSIGGDGLSFVQYIGVITSFYISTRNDISRQKKRRYGLMCFWIFFTLILVGRTGAVLSLIFIFLYLFSQKSLSNIISIMFKFAMVSVLLLAIGYIFIKQSYYDQVILQVLPHAFEFFYNFYLTGEFYTKTTNVIFSDMLVFPDNFITWMIGDGFWVNPVVEGNYVPSDIGYIRLLFYSGLLGSLLLYSWLFCAYLMIRKRFCNSNLRVFIDCYIITLFIAHIKFPFILSSVSLFIIFLFVIVNPRRKYHLVEKIFVLQDDIVWIPFSLILDKPSFLFIISSLSSGGAERVMTRMANFLLKNIIRSPFVLGRVSVSKISTPCIIRLPENMQTCLMKPKEFSKKSSWLASVYCFFVNY